MAGQPKRSYTVAALRGAARAPGTLEAYRRDWQRFVTWCASQQCAALPAAPDDVAAFLAEQAGRLKPASLERCLAAIRFHHRQAGLRLDAEEPVITDVRRGIRRTLGTDQVRKAPLSVEDLGLISAALPGSLAGLRDRALILVGFAGAFRRGELAGTRVEDLRFSACRPDRLFAAQQGRPGRPGPGGRDSEGAVLGHLFGQGNADVAGGG